MGISGFLPLVKSVQQPMHIKEYAGRTVAVDGNVWLHRGAFACAMELATQKETTKYVDYVMRQVDMLLFFNVTPLVVFDGNQLPIKKHTNDERRSRRKDAREKGLQLLRQGKTKEALEWLQKSVEVTPQMVQLVVKALDERHVRNVIAPYEADAQLAYLMATKKADAVLTEDSDLLIFGCDTVILKMNKFGEAVQIRRHDLSLTKEIDLSGWETEKIRHMCILSGCDYLPSLPGIGLKNAYKLLQKYKTTDMVLKHLRSQGKMKSVPDYECNFKRANDAFLYQHVIDIDSHRHVQLNTPPKDQDMSFLGTSPTSSQDTEKTTRAVKTTVSEADVVESKAPISLTHDNKENIPPWLREACGEKLPVSQNKPAPRRFKCFSLPPVSNTVSLGSKKRSSPAHTSTTLNSSSVSDALKADDMSSTGNRKRAMVTALSDVFNSQPKKHLSMTLNAKTGVSNPGKEELKPTTSLSTLKPSNSLGKPRGRGLFARDLNVLPVATPVLPTKTLEHRRPATPQRGTTV